MHKALRSKTPIVLQKVCDKHDGSFHPRFKQWADDYFVIKHRGERRGLGKDLFPAHDLVVGIRAYFRQRRCSGKYRKTSCFSNHDSKSVIKAILAGCPIIFKASLGISSTH